MEHTPTEIVKKYQAKAKYSKLVRQLGISMSLMGDANVRTVLAQSGNAPAWTEPRGMVSRYVGDGWQGRNSKWNNPNKRNYQTSFNKSLLPDNDLAVWLGTAWHELGHVVWSNFKNGTTITIALNLLEDARVEGLLLSKYPRTRGALMAMLSYMMSKTSKGTRGQDHVAYQYAWMCGRSHIDRAIRNKQRSLVLKSTADGIDRIFREYLSMGAKLDKNKAVDLSVELTKLLNLEQSLDQSMPVCGGVLSTMDPTDEDTEVDTSNIGGESEDTDDDEDAPSTRADRIRKSRELARELAKQFDKVAMDDDILEQEVKQLEEIIHGAGGLTGKSGVVSVAVPNSRAVNLAADIKRIAGKFNDESGKGLVRRRDIGRLKPMRYEIYDDLDTAFDMWEPGLDQEMYVTVLMDVSGSMNQAPVNEVVYGLEYGLNEVATVDVCYFNDTYWTPDVKADANRMNKIKPFGGTNPSDGTSYLYSKLMANGASNRMYVLYTDGGFNISENYEVVGAYIDSMIENGIHVRVIAEAGGNLNALKAQSRLLDTKHMHRVNGLADLPGIVLEWTRTVLTRSTS